MKMASQHPPKVRFSYSWYDNEWSTLTAVAYNIVLAVAVNAVAGE